MNSEQLKGQLRVWLVGIAGLVGGWFASKGWINEGTVSAIINSPVFAALVTMVAGAGWSWYNKTNQQLVAAVDALAKDPASPVKGVIVAPTTAGIALADSMPKQEQGQTTVPAGTIEAQQIAKT